MKTTKKTFETLSRTGRGRIDENDYDNLAYECEPDLVGPAMMPRREADGRITVWAELTAAGKAVISHES